MLTLFTDPEQFLKDLQNMPPAMLEGLKKQMMDIVDQSVEYYEAVEHGRYRTAARIFARNASKVALQVATGELGEALLLEGAVAEVSFAAKVASKTERKAASFAEKETASVAKKEAGAALETELPKGSPSYAKAPPPQLPTPTIKPVLTGHPSSVNGVTHGNLTFKQPGP